MRLTEKVAIVTGSGAGIGQSIVEAFAVEGARVVGASRRSVTGQPVVDALVRAGQQAIFVQCDVSVEDDVRRLMACALAEYGRIDILVNNAGVNFLKPFVETEPGDWDRVINTDLRGTFLCCRYAIPEMLKRNGGSIINIASVHATACLPGDAPYAAAKWGMVGFSKALAVEFASRSIRVNVVSPGAIETQITAAVMSQIADTELYLNWLYSNIPMRRRGLPQEVASACIYLASDEASYITGANLCVDGGVTSLLFSNNAGHTPSVDGKQR